MESAANVNEKVANSVEVKNTFIHFDQHVQDAFDPCPKGWRRMESEPAPPTHWTGLTSMNLDQKMASVGEPEAEPEDIIVQHDNFKTVTLDSLGEFSVDSFCRQVSNLTDMGFCRQETEQAWPTYPLKENTHHCPSTTRPEVANEQNTGFQYVHVFNPDDWLPSLSTPYPGLEASKVGQFKEAFDVDSASPRSSEVAKPIGLQVTPTVQDRPRDSKARRRKGKSLITTAYLSQLRQPPNNQHQQQPQSQPQQQWQQEFPKTSPWQQHEPAGAKPKYTGPALPGEQEAPAGAKQKYTGPALPIVKAAGTQQLSGTSTEQSAPGKTPKQRVTFCPFCGAGVEPHFKFCRFCGQQVPCFVTP